MTEALAEQGVPLAGQLRGRKSIDRMIADSELPRFRLNKSLGPWSMVAIGVGAIIGAGIYFLAGIAAGGRSYPIPSAIHRPTLEVIWQLLHGTLPGPGFHTNPPAGPAVVLSFLLLVAICALIGACYAELASLMPLAGSVYNYSYAALGEVAAWMTGWTLVLEYGLGNVVVASAFSGELKARLADFHILIPNQWSMPAWSEGKWTGAYFNVPAFLMVLAVTVVLSLGIRVFSRANILMVILKAGAIVFFLILGSTLIRPVNWHPFAPSGMKGVLAAGILLFYSYVGFECVSVAAEEAKRPERDVAIGIFASLVICALLYGGVAAVLLGMVPYAVFGSGAAGSNVPVLYALQHFGAKPLSLGVIVAGMLIGLLSVMFVLQYGQTRLWYAMSRDGLVPEVFSSLHPKTRTPHWCVWIGGAAVALLSGLMDVGEAADLVANGVLVAFALVAICVMC
ncbi:MAG TPA: amino acid permease, partial [Candidatus Solibacter sp.]|nr:amino acid permease [Candidatus Solibacter sp.]